MGGLQMVQVSADAEASAQAKRRGRGAAKTFPLSPFEDVLKLPKTIREHGLDGTLRRITVFDRLKRSPESGLSRQLVTDSGKYSLTSGGYKAEHLRLTKEGAKVVDPQTPAQERKRLEFELAVKRIQPFNMLYERLKGKGIPAPDVLKDQLDGVPEPDREQCARVFTENARYVGLIRHEAGKDRIMDVNQALEQLPAAPAGREPSPEPAKPIEEAETATPAAPAEPALHVDVNIHIDAAASAEQIDQLFASMARHLYGRQQ
jgi:hypothetical protein